MPNLVTVISPGELDTCGAGFIPPVVIADQGHKAAERFSTFFTDTVPNDNTRDAYYRNTMLFFAWAHAKGLGLPTIKSYHAVLHGGQSGHPTGKSPEAVHLGSVPGVT